MRLITPTQQDIETMQDVILAEGGFDQLADALGWSRRTVISKTQNDPEFRRAWLQAKQDLADVIAEDVLSIARETLPEDPKLAMAHVQRNRLLIDTIKWMAGKLKPKSWGDKLEFGEDTLKALSPLAQLRQLENTRTPTPPAIMLDAEMVETCPEVTDSDCF